MRKIKNNFIYAIYRVKIQIEGDKFKPEGMVEITKMATDNDEEKVKMAEEICAECSDVSDPDM